MTDAMPLLILAGGTPHGSTARGMPAGDTLVGVKGALRLPSGRPLVAEVASRYVASGRFQRPILIGPRDAYAELAGEFEVCHVTGSLARSLACAAAVMRDRFGRQGPIAISTCDILPRAEEITGLLERNYDPVCDCVFWGQLVEEEPTRLGSSAWKPGYEFLDDQGRTHHLYPGHLVILRPEALRLEIAIRLLHLAYSYRNQPLTKRVTGMTLRSLGMLLWQDMGRIVRRYPPKLTFAIPFHCLRAYRAYRRRTLTVAGFERAFTATFIDDAYQTGRGTVFAVTKLVSFARDLDTRAEFDEATRGL
jgi:hypothetical protein